MKILVVTGRDPECAFAENRELEVGLVSDRVVALDTDRLIGDHMQGRRIRTSEPLDDRALR